MSGFPQRVIEPRQAYSEIIHHNAVSNILEKRSISNLLGVLDQMNQLSKHACNVFESVLNQSIIQSKRIESCQKRINAMDSKIKPVETKFLGWSPFNFYDHPHLEPEWRRNDPIKGLLFRRTRASDTVNARRDKAISVPDWTVMDRFTPDGRPCVKGLSDPNFFLNEWLATEKLRKAEEHRRYKEKKAAKREKKKRRDKKNKANHAHKGRKRILAIKKKKYDEFGNVIEDKGDTYVDVHERNLDDDDRAMAGQRKLKFEQAKSNENRRKTMDRSKSVANLFRKHGKGKGGLGDLSDNPDDPDDAKNGESQSSTAALKGEKTGQESLKNSKLPAMKAHARSRTEAIPLTSHQREKVAAIASEQGNGDGDGGGPGGPGGPPPPPPASVHPNGMNGAGIGEGGGGPPPFPANLASEGAPPVPPPFTGGIGSQKKKSQHNQQLSYAAPLSKIAMVATHEPGLSVIDALESGPPPPPSSSVPTISPQQQARIDEQANLAAAQIPSRPSGLMAGIRKGVQLKRTEIVKREAVADSRSTMLSAIAGFQKTKMNKVDRAQIQHRKQESAGGGNAIFAALQMRREWVASSDDGSSAESSGWTDSD